MTCNISAELVKTIPILGTLCDHEIKAISKASSIIAVQKNRYILTKGDRSNGLFILLSGSAKVAGFSKAGKEFFFCLIGVGDFAGELSIIDELPHSADVIATTACKVLLIPSEQFMDLLHVNKFFRTAIMRKMASNLRDSNKKIQSFVFLSTKARVQECLLSMATKDESGRQVIPANIRRQQIASFVGSSREMVSRIMTELELAKSLEKSNKSYVLNFECADF